MALDGLGERSRGLIDGLGMGFTLAAARGALPMGAGTVVAELVPKIVIWTGDHLRHLIGSSLEDPRISMDVRDVHDLIVDQAGGFDAMPMIGTVAFDPLRGNWPDPRCADRRHVNRREDLRADRMQKGSVAVKGIIAGSSDDPDWDVR